MSTHNQNWHVQVKEEDRNFTNTHIEQIEDPLKAIMVKKRKETHLAELLKYHPENLNVKLSGTPVSKVQSIVQYIVFMQTPAELRDSESL